MRTLRYETKSGIAVSRTLSKAPYRRGLQPLLQKLDRFRGFYLSSGYEYPGRYSRWDIAAITPPVEIVSSGRKVDFNPLNARGEMLCRMIGRAIDAQPFWEDCQIAANGAIRATLKPLPAFFAEEERSKQPSVFSVLRALVEEFRHPMIRASPSSAPSATICSSSSTPSSSASRAATAKTSISFSATTSTTWIARRSRSSGSNTISPSAI